MELNLFDDLSNAFLDVNVDDNGAQGLDQGVRTREDDEKLQEKEEVQAANLPQQLSTFHALLSKT